MLDVAKKGDFTVDEKANSDCSDSDSDYATDTDMEDETSLENDNEED